MNKKNYLIGYASDIAGAVRGSSDAPFVMQKSPFLSESTVEWFKIIQSNKELISVSQQVADQCHQLASSVSQLVKENKFFTVVGGDHSSAMGTWSGVSSALYDQGPVGLIWVDAHMDSHTPHTSQTGNIHGMPLASLLGFGDPSFTTLLGDFPKLKPEHVCLIGVRSFEKGEAELLKKLNVRIFLMDEVQTRGLDAVMKEALKIVTKETVGFGISIDVDAVDPIDAPGTGVPEKNGIRSKDLCRVLQQQIAEQPQLIGAEIVEFDPHRDKDQLTEKLVADLIFFLNENK